MLIATILVLLLVLPLIAVMFDLVAGNGEPKVERRASRVIDVRSL